MRAIYFLLLLLLAAPLCAQDATKLLQDFEKKHSALGKEDVAGRRDLAKWCATNHLLTRQKQVMREILGIEPDDAEAHKALGHVKDEGLWCDSLEILYTSQGKSRRLTDWAKLSTEELAKLQLIHGHYLSADEAAKLDAGEPLAALTLPEGIEVLTREYRFVSALDKAKTLELARMMEQAVRAWRDDAGLKFDAAKRQTLQIEILKSNEAFVAMIKSDLEVYDQELVKAQGFFDGELCHMSYFHDWYRTERVMLHECRHQFDAVIARNMAHMTGWYMEGTAEYWSVHTWDSKTLKTGVLNPDDNEDMFFAAKLARGGKLKGAEETLLHPWAETIDPVFYQNAWAFIYFLRSSKAYADGFKKWEEALLAGKYDTPEDQVAGFKELVCKDLKAFDKAYRDEIKSMWDLAPAKWK